MNDKKLGKFLSPKVACWALRKQAERIYSINQFREKTSSFLWRNEQKIDSQPIKFM